jgi:signal transduction histidine kinase
MAAGVEDTKQARSNAETNLPAGVRDKIDALVRRARDVRLSDPAAGMAYSRRAYTLSAAAGYQAGVTDSLLLLGILNYLQGNYRAALAQLLEVGPLAEDRGQRRIAGESLLTIARVYHLLGDSATALEYALAAIGHCQAAGYGQGEAEAHNMIGIIRSRLNDHRQELAEFQQALQIYRQLGDISGEATILNDIAMAHMALQEYEQALASGNECLAMAQRNELPMLEANVWCTLGEIRLGRGDHDEALENFQKSIVMSRRLGFKYVEMYALMMSGQVYLLRDELRQAGSILPAALAMAEEIDTKTELAKCHQLLTQVYKQQGDFETALHHHEQFHALHEEVFNEETEQKTRFLQIVHDTETAQKEAEIFRLKNAELEKEIAERKRIEEQRLQIAVEREKSRVLTQFIEDALHEFRTPLSTISLNLFMLQQNVDDPKSKGYLTKIESQSDSILALVEALASMARLDSRAALQLHTSPLPAIIQGVVAVRRDVLRQRELVLNLTADSHLPSVPVDEEQLALALGSMVDNAIQHTGPGGSIIIRTTRQADEVVIAIQDTGVGIDAEDLPHIFKRFWRKDKARSTRGFGLGLPIARQIIDLHGGRIVVDSRPGEGSSFKIILPVK